MREKEGVGLAVLSYWDGRERPVWWKAKMAALPSPVPGPAEWDQYRPSSSIPLASSSQYYSLPPMVLHQRVNNFKSFRLFDCGIWRLECTVIRFLWVIAKFGACTVVSLNRTLLEAKICIFTLESTHFIVNKCSIYTHDGASAKFIAFVETKRITVW